jgi:hypothetical protein
MTADAIMDEVRKELGEDFRLVEIADTATVEGLSRDLGIEERLDAMIDKCLKRLLFLRVLKSLQPVPSPAPPQAVPATIPSPKKVA